MGIHTIGDATLSKHGEFKKDELQTNFHGEPLLKDLDTQKVIIPIDTLEQKRKDRNIQSMTLLTGRHQDF